MSLNESIKKYSLKYVHCPNGGLHAGQVMNLVCVDSTCNHRGLICPICRMQSHEKHQILPIKTFLQQIRSLFTQSDNQDDLNNLSDFLRALENSKKEIIGNLRSQVTRLAQSFKALQQKIQQNFASVRKNVLIQSSITTKLPTLLTLLTQQNVNKDSAYIQQQFKKYTQLLKYQNEKIKISDKAKALVENYSSIPAKLQDLLSAHSAQYVKKLESLPKFFEERQIGKSQSSETSASSYTFSTQNKFFDIILEEENKLAKASDQAQQIGYIFVNQNKGQTNQKIVLEIVQNISNKISIGLGDVDQFRNVCSFMYDSTIQNKKQCYSYLYSNGYTKPPPAQYDSEQQSNQEPLTASYMTGDIMEIEWNGTELTFLNKTTQEKRTLNPEFSQTSKKNLQFVVGLAESDSVRILNQ